jgi:histone-lysine N-methyltransferase SETMAR
MIASVSSVLLWTMEGDYHGQRWTTWFLCKEGVSAADIHRQLAAVCGDAAPSRRTVFRWVESFNSGHVTVMKGISPSCPPTARTSSAVQRLPHHHGEQTCNHRWIAPGNIFLSCNNSCNNPRRFKDEGGLCTLGSKGSHARTKGQRGAELPGAAHSSKKDPEWLIARLVTGDESWFHCQNPEIKRQSVQWKHDSPCPKKFQTAPSAGKQMASVFWDIEGILLIEWLPHGQTINSEMYCNTLTCLCRRIQLRRQGKWACQVPFLHDNVRRHSSKKKKPTQQLASLGYTVLPHPPYSPDFAPSDYALFNKMKEPLRGRILPTSDDLERGVRDSVRSTPKDRYPAAIQKLLERRQQCTDLRGEYVESTTVWFVTSHK